MVEVRTKDETLEKALRVWFKEKEALHKDRLLVFTDLDSEEALQAEYEITCSYGKKADLVRPFSFSDLEEFIRAYAEKPKKRLLFLGDDIYLDGVKRDFTRRERALLEALAGASEPLSASELSSALGDDRCQSNKIAVLVAGLRKKTEENGRLIFTQQLKGYYIKND